MARVVGFTTAFKTAHTRRMERRPQHHTYPGKRRVAMHMAPIVVPYPGHEYHVYTRWPYSLFGICSMCVHAFHVKNIIMGRAHRSRQKKISNANFDSLLTR